MSPKLNFFFISVSCGILQIQNIVDGAGFNLAEKFQNSKEIVRNISTTDSSSDSIQILQWAVELDVEHIARYESDLRLLLKGLDLELHLEPIGSHKNWILIDHPLHVRIQSSLRDIHDRVHNTSTSDSSYGNDYKQQFTNPVRPNRIQAIRSLFKRSLMNDHGIDERTWRNLVIDTERKLHKHPYIKRYRLQKAKFRQKRSLHFNDPDFQYQWHLVSGL